MLFRKKPASMKPLVIALSPPHRALQQRAALLCALAGGLLFLSTFGRSALVLQAIGSGTLGFALWVLWAALRVRGWSGFRLTLTDRTLELPMSPLWRRETVRVKLEDVELVSFAVTGERPRVQILTRGGLWLVPFAWFPRGSSPVELGLRVHVRSQLARAGTAPSAAKLAALEQTIIDGKGFGAYVSEPIGEAPRVLATLDDPSERDALAATIKGQGARLYDCSEEIRALRDALERGLAAPVLRSDKSKPKSE